MIRFTGLHSTLQAPLLCLLLATGPAWAAESESSPTDNSGDVRSLAKSIDRILSERWAAEGVKPAPPADDAEFMRRVSLDISGKIPTVGEARDFLDSNAPHKRGQLVDHLLSGSGYVMQFGDMWRRVMMPEASADLQARFLVPEFETWLRRKLLEDVGYDQLVRELLTAPVQGGRRSQNDAVAFFRAKQVKPENLAAATSRMFLGLRIECAQCHDHPFDEWKREQFWGFAAFFAGIERRPSSSGVLGGLQELFTRRTLNIPGTNEVVSATYLDGTRATGGDPASSRRKLAEWITARDNPYFARATANRIWGHFFGIGIVDPIDDFSQRNPASHPQLLDTLAAELAGHQFDIKFLIRAITTSHAYQLTSRQTDSSQDKPHLFARMALKGLTPVQLFDSLAQATGLQQALRTRVNVIFGGNSARAEFLERFRNEADRPTERQTTILQALAMMNGSFIADATHLDRSTTLSAIADFPQFDTKDRVEALYLSTLSRRPRPKELASIVEYIDRGGTKSRSKSALGDVFWALLNSSEFMFNH